MWQREALSVMVVMSFRIDDEQDYLCTDPECDQERHDRVDPMQPGDPDGNPCNNHTDARGEVSKDVHIEHATGFVVRVSAERLVLEPIPDAAKEGDGEHDPTHDFSGLLESFDCFMGDGKRHQSKKGYVDPEPESAGFVFVEVGASQFDDYDRD